MREGQGSYFYAQKNKLFVGEYVEDLPKVGIYTEVQDAMTQNIDPDRLRNFDDIPPIPVLGLRDPVGVLEKGFKRVRQRRILYRARYMSVGQMFQPGELDEMLHQFAAYGSQVITTAQLVSLLENLGIEIEGRFCLKQLPPFRT